MAHIIHLKRRSVLSLKGADVLTFLQGLVTHDMGLLSTEPALYTALLTPQGRYVFDFFIMSAYDGYWIDCAEARAPELLKMLQFYKFRSDVTLEDVSKEYAVLHCLPPAAVPKAFKERGSFFQDPRHPSLGLRGITSQAFLKGLVLEPDEHAYQVARITVGAPEEEDVIPQKSFPFEINLDVLNAISFNKGCYLGQELTTRTKFRGETRKRLLPCLLQAPIAHASPIPVMKEGVEIGEIRSVHFPFALAMLRLEALDAGSQTPATAHGTLISILKPDWFRG